eukprot:tig00000404_g383.t1
MNYSVQQREYTTHASTIGLRGGGRTACFVKDAARWRDSMELDDDNPPSPRGELLGDGDEAEGAGAEETAGDDTGEQRKGDEGAHAPQQPMVAAASPAASGSPAPQPVNLAQTIAAFSAKLSENKQLEELAAPLLQALLQQLPAAAAGRPPAGPPTSASGQANLPQRIVALSVQFSEQLSAGNSGILDEAEALIAQCQQQQQQQHSPSGSDSALVAPNVGASASAQYRHHLQLSASALPSSAPIASAQRAQAAAAAAAKAKAAAGADEAAARAERDAAVDSVLAELRGRHGEAAFALREAVDLVAQRLPAASKAEAEGRWGAVAAALGRGLVPAGDAGGRLQARFGEDGAGARGPVADRAAFVRRLVALLRELRRADGPRVPLARLAAAWEAWGGESFEVLARASLREFSNAAPKAWQPHLVLKKLLGGVVVANGQWRPARGSLRASAARAWAGAVRAGYVDPGAAGPDLGESDFEDPPEPTPAPAPAAPPRTTAAANPVAPRSASDVAGPSARPAASHLFPPTSSHPRRVDQSAAARSSTAATPPAAARPPAKSHYASVEEAQRDLESIAGELAAARGGPATIPFRDVARAWRARHAGADKARRLLPEGAGDARTLPGALAAVAGLPERGAWRAVPAGVWRGRLVARLVQTAGGAGDVAMAEAAEPATTGPVAGDESGFPPGGSKQEAERWLLPACLAGACAALVGQPEQRAEMALLKALQHIGARANARTRKVELQAGIGAAAVKAWRVASGGADSDGGAGHDCDNDFGDGTDAEETPAQPILKAATHTTLTMLHATAGASTLGLEGHMPNPLSGGYDEPELEDGEIREEGGARDKRPCAADFMETQSAHSGAGDVAALHMGRDSAAQPASLARKEAASATGGAEDGGELMEGLDELLGGSGAAAGADVDGTGTDGGDGLPGPTRDVKYDDIWRIGQAMLRALPRAQRGHISISKFKARFQTHFRTEDSVDNVLDNAGLPRLRTAIRMFFPDAVTVQPPTGPLWMHALRSPSTAIDVTIVGDAEAALVQGLRLASQWRDLNGHNLQRKNLELDQTQADAYHLYDAVIDSTGSVKAGAEGRVDNVKNALLFMQRRFKVPDFKQPTHFIRTHLSHCATVYTTENNTVLVRITGLFSAKPGEAAVAAYEAGPSTAAGGDVDDEFVADGDFDEDVDEDPAEQEPREVYYEGTDEHTVEGPGPGPGSGDEDAVKCRIEVDKDILVIGSALLRGLRSPRRTESISVYKDTVGLIGSSTIDEALRKANLPLLRTSLRMFFNTAVRVAPASGAPALRSGSDPVSVSAKGDVKASFAAGLQTAMQWRRLNGANSQRSDGQRFALELYDALTDATGSLKAGATGPLSFVVYAWTRMRRCSPRTSQWLRNISDEPSSAGDMAALLPRLLGGCVEIVPDDVHGAAVRIRGLLDLNQEHLRGLGPAAAAAAAAAPGGSDGAEVEAGPLRAQVAPASRSGVDGDVLEIGHALLRALSSLQNSVRISAFKELVEPIDGASIVYALRNANLPLLRTSLRLFFDGAVNVAAALDAAGLARLGPGPVAVAVQGDLNTALEAGLAAAMEWRRLNGPAGSQMSEAQWGALGLYDVLTDATGSARPGATSSLEDVARAWNYTNLHRPRALQWMRRLCGGERLRKAPGEPLSADDMAALLPRLLGDCVEIVADGSGGLAVRVRGLLSLHQEHLRGCPRRTSPPADAALPSPSPQPQPRKERRTKRGGVRNRMNAIQSGGGGGLTIIAPAPRGRRERDAGGVHQAASGSSSSSLRPAKRPRGVQQVFVGQYVHVEEEEEGGAGGPPPVLARAPYDEEEEEEEWQEEEEEEEWAGEWAAEEEEDGGGVELAAPAPAQLAPGSALYGAYGVDHHVGVAQAALVAARARPAPAFYSTSSHPPLLAMAPAPPPPPPPTVYIPLHPLPLPPPPPPAHVHMYPYYPLVLSQETD